MGDELTYGFVMPLFPLLPILAIMCQSVLAVHLHAMSRIAWIVGPMWVGAGLIIYQLYSKSRAVATEDEILVFEEERAPAGDEYRIMVAVANPENALELVRNTYKLCAAKKARVELLHMVPVPDQVPLTDADRYMREGQAGIVEAMLYLAPLFPVSTTLRYCRNIARGIVNAVREKKTDMLIMGWHGETRARAFNLGSTVDPVIERSPCSVVVLKDCGNRKFTRVLVPLAGGANTAFALEVASILADRDEGEIVALTVVGDGPPFDIEQFVNDNLGRLHLPPERVSTKTVEARNVVDAILEEADQYDLVVLGCTREPLLYRVARATVPETIAQRCTKPLVTVKASGRIRSWIKRWV